MKTSKKKKARKTALSKHFSELGKKGGKAVLKKHGREHFRQMAMQRWEEEGAQ